MDLTNFFSDNSIIINCKSKSKKNVLEIISKVMSELTSTKKDIIFEKLYEREKLGTTAFGNGIAIPHARIDNISEAKIMLLKLETPIEFEAIDGKKVDLILSLLVPNNKDEVHIELLSKVSEMLDDKLFREKIKQSSNELEILSLIKNYK